jgi:hydroxypyruvate reductase
MSVDPQQLLRELFATAIDAAHPNQVLEAHLPADRSGRVIVIGAGKAAAAMAKWSSAAGRAKSRAWS